MDDSVEVALRRKRDSSMRVAIAQLKAAKASAGRRRLRLGRQHRRADGAGALPAQDARGHRPPGHRHRDAQPPRRLHHRARPRRQRRLHARAPAAVRGHGQRAGGGGGRQGRAAVGLLNIGEEAIKGSETIKRAGELLRAAGEGGQINFHGNVEGNDIFKGTVDIVVCDGFVGNVLLKTSEGPGLDAGRLHPPGVHARPVQQAGGAGGAAGAATASSTASTRAATTARRCWACAGWSSRATARPTPTPSSRRWRGLMMPRATGCSTACTTASAPPWRRCRRPTPRIGTGGMNTSWPPLFPHHRHRQPPAAAAADQRRHGGAAGRARRRDQRRLDRRAHRHPRAPLRRRRRRLQRPGAARRARRARSGRPPRRGRGPDHRRHLDARHGVPVHRLHPAAQARHRAAAPPSTCRPCARASSTR